MEMIDVDQLLPTDVEFPLTSRPFLYGPLREAQIRLIHLDRGLSKDSLAIQNEENVYLDTAPRVGSPVIHLGFIFVIPKELTQRPFTPPSL